MTNDYTVLIPNFAVEKKTKALNTGVWGFVGVISMFTVGFAVFVSHLMLVSILEITSTFASDNMMIAGLCPIMAFAFIFGIGLFIFLSSLQTAYVIQPDKIIKGKITNKAYRNNAKSLAVQTALTAYMAANVLNGSKVSGANGIKNLFGILELISLNMEDGFAQQFFFTELYKRKEYHKPQLIKETKHFYTYLCGNKKLKIRKVYTGMDNNVQNAKGVSILKRVIVRVLLVIVIFSTISIADIAIGLGNNNNYINNITQNYTEIETELADFGYKSDKVNNKCYRFEKIVSSQRTSYIKYFFDLDGSVEKVEFEIYFDKSSDRIEQEIEYIFTSLNDGITKQQIEKFTQDTQSTIQGNYVYNKLQTNNYLIVLGTSGEHAHIHN